MEATHATHSTDTTDHGSRIADRDRMSKCAIFYRFSQAQHQPQPQTPTSNPPRDKPTKAIVEEETVCHFIVFVFEKERMHATAICHMARGKGATIPIKLLSSAGTGFFYTTRKNVNRTKEKVRLVKFDPIVRRRVLFKEAKIK